MLAVMIKETIIIGAGLSGLNTARQLQGALVLEKSRGLGGRMATRRTLETRFDHGAQFYRRKVDLTTLHEFWSEKNANHKWFISPEGEHWCSDSGMTALAKVMGPGLEISLEKEVQSISYENNLWKLVSTKNEEWLCRRLIISAPTPQAVKLLANVEKEKTFNQSAFQIIKNVQYTKALILLVTLEESMNLENGYLEFIAGDFFSLSDQKQKGVSSIPALTVTMSAEFSEREFENQEDEIHKKILESLKLHYPDLKIKQSELKKWRYCRPETQYPGYFVEMAPELFLIGDAFGGSSLAGAVRSSEALCRHLST